MTQAAPVPQPPIEGRRRRWDSRALLRWSRTTAGRRATWALAGVLVLFLLAGWLILGSREVTDDATVEGPIHPVAPRIGGIVSKVYIDNHDFVEAGDVLVEIDPTGYEVRRAKAAADLAEAVAIYEAAKAGVPIASTTTESELKSARAATDDAEAGVLLGQEQIEAASARLRVAEAEQRRAAVEYERASKDLDRLRPLVEKDEISLQEFDAAEGLDRSRRAELDAAEAGGVVAANEVEIAHKRVSQARAALRRSRAQLEAAGTGPQQVSVIEAQAASALARVEQRQAQLRQADLELSYTKIKAPSSGRISRKSVETGQFLRQGQTLFAVVDLEQVWIVARFKETQLERIRVGQEARIRVDAYPGTLRGRVKSIGGATTSRFSLLPPQNSTGNFVKVVQRVPVEILIEEDIDPERPLRPGMSVVAKVLTR